MRPVRYITFVLLAMLTLLPGCSGEQRGNPDGDRTYNVLCLFVYDSVFQNYRIYEQTLSKSLSQNGIKADIRNVYSSGHLDMAQSDALEASLERLNKENWIPDVVCCIDDRTLSLYLQGEYDRWLPPVDSIPMVAAGLRCPDWPLIRRSNNTAVCTDLLNFQRNIELAVRMAPYTAVPGRPMYPNIVAIELDTTDYDKRIRERLRSELDRPPYVNNMDYHVKDLSLEQLSERYRDSIFINVFSNASPELNDYRSDGDYHVHRVKMLNSLTMTPFLTVKRDIENEQVLSKTLKPQFSAVRDGFADGSRRSLCGYFASYETVAKDQASYVARILKGEAAGSLPIKEHEAGYYMSWRAMELLNLDYDDFCNDFVIVNAPWRVQHPVRYVLFIIFDILLFLVVLLLALHMLFRKKDVQLQEALDEIDNERVMLDMALQNADCIVIGSPDDLTELEPMLHPDDSDAISELLATLASGKPVTARKFRLTKDGGASYRWWQFRPSLNMKSEEHGAQMLESLSGIVIDINDAELYNEYMTEAALVAEEITNKETFLMNISHEIRTPLNAILGFAQLLSTDDGLIQGDERDEIVRLIRENSTLLGEMIEDILQFSRFESGRVDVNPVETEIAPLMKRIFDEWSQNVPQALEFKFEAGRDHVYAVVDPARVEAIMGQYIKNAFKFTSKGTVWLGWCFNLNEERVELYVEDTGCGIESRRQSKVFNIFWKDDMFKTGVGLGLTIAKMFTEKMEGNVGVESKPGVGSRFHSSFKAYIK
ncbi:MAG: sensor histidine kinase [Bacteroidaceae bacterium]|nr:sensor histidine kinase [Bacteroidaceae bacterium]